MPDLRPFFPHSFLAMPVAIVRPMATWDYDADVYDDDAEKPATVDLDAASAEEFSPMPGFE